MIDASSGGDSLESTQFKIDILSTLSSLPVPNKTMLLDSKLITIVEKWTTVNENNQTAAKKDDAAHNDGQTEPDNQIQTELDNRVSSSPDIYLFLILFRYNSSCDFVMFEYCLLKYCRFSPIKSWFLSVLI